MFLSLIMIYGAIYFSVIFFTTLFHLPTAEAFDRKAAEVSSMMDLSRLITQVFDFKELADTVTKVTTSVCNSDSAWLVIKKDDDYELTSVSNISLVEADKVTDFMMEENILDDGRLVTLDKKLIQQKIKNTIRVINFKALIVAPLRVHNRTNGFLFTARKQNFTFDDDDRNSVEAFADYAAVALENAKLIEESIEKERLESELNVAREIQYKILPNETPNYDNVDISALFIPAFEVGGDYYDFFKLGEDKLGFVIADVSGKGISAAFIMAEVKGIFETLSLLVESPRELLTAANNILKKSLDKKNFVTAIYGVLDTEKGILNFSRAGHVPMLLCKNNKIEKLVPMGIGLGLDFTKTFSDNLKELEIKLNNDDILILYTDGITESKNNENMDYGEDRFEKVIMEGCNGSLDALSSNIVRSVSEFSANSSQHDDITLVMFKWKNFNKSPGVN